MCIPTQERGNEMKIISGILSLTSLLYFTSLLGSEAGALPREATTPAFAVMLCGVLFLVPRAAKIPFHFLQIGFLQVDAAIVRQFENVCQAVSKLLA